MSETLPLLTKADYSASPSDENQFVYSLAQYATLLPTNTFQTNWVKLAPKADHFPLPAPKEKDAPTDAALSADTEKIFNGLVKKWQDETASSSVMTRRYAHSSYHSILLLKEEAVPLILRELKERPDWWFEALELLTKANPVKPNSTFEEAVNAWLEWGEQNHRMP